MAESDRMQRSPVFMRMIGRVFSVVVVAASVVGVALALEGCTYVVLTDENAPAPCKGAGDCEAGFACVAASTTGAAKVCTKVDDADAPPLPGVHVGVDGGSVAGPGIALLFDANAVPDDVQVVVSRASPTNVAVGVTTRSPFFSVQPPTTLENRVVVTIDALGCDNGCHVFKRPAVDGDAWIALDAGAGGADKAAGVLQANDDLSGVYVAGVVTP